LKHQVGELKKQVEDRHRRCEVARLEMAHSKKHIGGDALIVP
jgi:hypothetical protein